MSQNRKNYYFWNKDAFQEAVKDNVCSRCAYGSTYGLCTNPDPRGCAIMRYLPELVMTAQDLKDPNSGDYLRAVHEHIPMECANPRPSEHCQYMDTLKCGLRNKLPLILDTVLSVDRELELRPGFNGV